MAQSISVVGIILKKHNVAESDALVTLLTQEKGKIVVRSKGNRKLHSHKRAAIEPGNVIRAHCIVTKSLPLLTQTKLLNSCRDHLTDTLTHYRRLQQVLEFFDALFVEEELEPRQFAVITQLYEGILTNTLTKQQLMTGFNELLVSLGYQPIESTPYASLNEYISNLTERQMKAYEFLVVSQ